MVNVREELLKLQRQLQNTVGRLTNEVESAKIQLRDVELALNAVDGKPLMDNVAFTGTKAENSGAHTIKEMVLEILGVMPDGAEATELLTYIKDRFGANLVRTSLSPQLSRLKKEGLISLSGKVWKLNKIGSDESEPLENVGAGDGSRELDSYPQPDGSIPSASTPISQSEPELELGSTLNTNPDPPDSEKGARHDPIR
ncbi:MAG: hypothetical protein AAFV37_04285 [Pseudomonadota bacterium]